MLFRFAGCLLNFGSEGTLVLSQQIMDIVGFLKSQFICHLLICYIFIASGLIINFIQLFTLVLWPINKQLFRRINCRLAYCISSRKISFFFFFLEVFSCFVLRALVEKF